VILTGLRRTQKQFDCLTSWLAGSRAVQNSSSHFSISSIFGFIFTFSGRSFGNGRNFEIAFSKFVFLYCFPRIAVRRECNEERGGAH